MPRYKSKKETLVAMEMKLQLRWECLRLNRHYRDYYDFIHLKSFQKPNFKKIRSSILSLSIMPDYREKDIRRAIRLAYPNSGKSKIDFIMKCLYEENFGTTPEKCRSSVHLLDHANGRQQFIAELTFDRTAAREEVKGTVDRLFDELEKLKKMETDGDKEKQRARRDDLREALGIYESMEYGKQTLSEIARARQTSNEDYNAAYNRIKGQYQTAKRYVEDGKYELV